MPNFFINVKEKGAKKAAGNIGGLTASMKKMAAQAAVVTVALQTMKKGIVRAAEVEGVKRGFDNLANATGFSSKAFDKFSKATDRTIDNLTLMKKANAAMLLGITDSEDQMANMFDVAQRLGQSLGIDTVQSIDSLVTGMGRQSKLMLDNLGIMVDTNKSYKDFAEANNIAVSAMTDTQRKQAFVNAAMKEANFLVEQLGSEQLTTKDSIAQMNTALLESLTAFGNLLTPFVIPLAKGLELIAVGASSVIEQFGNLGHEFTGATTSLSGFNVWLKANEEDEEALKNKTAELNKEQKRLKEELAGLTSTGEQAIDFTKDFAMTIDMTGGSVDQHGNAVSILSESQAEFTKRLFESGIGLEEFKNQQEETTLVTINDNTERAKAIQFAIEEAERKKALILALKEEEVAEKATLEQKLKSMSMLTGGLSKLAGQHKQGAKVAKRLAQAQAIIDTWAAGNKALASAPPPWNFVAMAGVIAAGMANVASIEAQKLAQGGDFVTSGPQMLMVGDNPSGREHVQVTPLGGDPNINGPQGGGSVTVNVSGNVLTQDFVENELAENIKEAIRRGADFGVS